MGRDKALLDYGGEPLIARPIAALRARCGEVLLATGRTPRYAALGLEIVLDASPGDGPLAGLCAVLERARTAWVAVLACDMPHASAEVVEELLARTAVEGLDACLLRTEKGVEPLCAVYRRECAPFARAALDAGERRLISFHALDIAGVALAVGELDEANLPRALRGSARNLNTPEDVAGASPS
jgi:molybdopterin-guanine dinucleotide biosynthesis protein A